jgi:poly(3-hydroxybutyrate) depolymerase
VPGHGARLVPGYPRQRRHRRALQRQAPRSRGLGPRYTARWARRDGCAPRPRTTTPRPRLTRYAYGGCDDGLRVELLRLSGTDHGWRGAGPLLPDHNPSGLSATRELLRFVAGAQ